MIKIILDEDKAQLLLETVTAIHALWKQYVSCQSEDPYVRDTERVKDLEDLTHTIKGAVDAKR